jgi:hypothetical protein
MSEQSNDTVATSSPTTYTFTEPNPFLSETGHLQVGTSVTPMQRTLNEVPTQRERESD